MFRVTSPASVVMVSKVWATEFLQKLMYVQVLKVKQLKHFIFPQAQYIKQLLDEVEHNVMSCPRTQHNVHSQGSNLDRSI